MQVFHIVCSFPIRKTTLAFKIAHIVQNNKMESSPQILTNHSTLPLQCTASSASSDASPSTTTTRLGLRPRGISFRNPRPTPQNETTALRPSYGHNTDIPRTLYGQDTDGTWTSDGLLTDYTRAANGRDTDFTWAYNGHKTGVLRTDFTRTGDGLRS